MTGAPRGKELSVLVIDESTAALALISRILAARGIRALLARDAAEAASIAGWGFLPIDLLLVGSLGMSLQEFDTISEIRRLRPEVPMLGLSAVEEDGVIQVAVAGADGAARGAGLVESIRAACGIPGAVRSMSAGRDRLF